MCKDKKVTKDDFDNMKTLNIMYTWDLRCAIDCNGPTVMMWKATAKHYVNYFLEKNSFIQHNNAR